MRSVRIELKRDINNKSVNPACVILPSLSLSLSHSATQSPCLVFFFFFFLNPAFTSLGSADLSELWGSFRLRRGEKGACVLQSAAKGHLADLAVRPVAAHLPLVVWQHLGHCGTTEKKDHQISKCQQQQKKSISKSLSF